MPSLCFKVVLVVIRSKISYILELRCKVRPNNITDAVLRINCYKYSVAFLILRHYLACVNLFNHLLSFSDSVDTDNSDTLKYNYTLVGKLAMDIWSLCLSLLSISVSGYRQVNIQQSKTCYTRGCRNDDLTCNNYSQLADLDYSTYTVTVQ